MKRLLVLGGFIFSFFSMTAMASPEAESQVTLAKNQLAEAFIKGGLLTDSFTEKARNNLQAAGQKLPIVWRKILIVWLFKGSIMGKAVNQFPIGYLKG